MSTWIALPEDFSLVPSSSQLPQLQLQGVQYPLLSSIDTALMYTNPHLDTHIKDKKNVKNKNFKISIRQHIHKNND